MRFLKRNLCIVICISVFAGASRGLKLKKIIGSAFMGDLLSTLPSRFQCVGARNNFTNFLLFSRVHPDTPRPLRPGNRELLYKSDFDPDIPTKIILHGFVDNLHISDWMQKMKTALLTEGDYNVIMVDWSCGNEFPYYQAVQKSKTVAEQLKKLMIFLQDATGTNPAQFHLIGHSLGSHISALVGHGIPNLGRISALDPAGPRFYDAPLEERLDATDAQFVDVIHTDAGLGLLEGLGMRSQLGHVDFYPNGGTNQPGCHNSPLSILPRIGLQRAARYYLTCDHFRSIDYYIDSIRTRIEARSADGPVCMPVGVVCRDWETYAQGRCADCSHAGDCIPMGYNSDLFLHRDLPTKKEYFVKTSEEEPFCLFQYQVIVDTGCDHGFCQSASDPSKQGFNPGSIRLELTTREGKLARLNLDEDSEKEMKPDTQYVYLATNRFPLGEIQAAKVWWGHPGKPEISARPSPYSAGLNLRKIQIVPIALPEDMGRGGKAVLMMLLLERFLSSDMDDFTEPILNGLRVIERSAIKHVRNVLPAEVLQKPRILTKFYLYSRQFVRGQRLDPLTGEGLHFFNPRLETKVIIHGFLDKVKIAEWMHHMKDEFLILDDFNVIIVDWSSGNFLPYTKAASNTEQVGEEIAVLMRELMGRYGAKPEKFHLLGHSLGSHVAGYVGEHIKGLRRISGLDPATYQFSNVSPRSKLDKSDALFVDVIHTDGGGIGMLETVGHVDFYPNGGEVQVGCTASNSIRSLLEKGVVEGARTVVCSHMRAPLLFTDTINAKHCSMLASACDSWENYVAGQCDFCQRSGPKCAELGYHVDMNRNYGNGTRYYFVTANDSPYCGYEYKIVFEIATDEATGASLLIPAAWRRTGFSDSDVLHVSIQGVLGSRDAESEAK
ncbi:uncharacterized protein LOC129220557 [Uloborus diversus]|uniref:uncharacterized protein LOC129220557 n=1 Tax=Uloborus diversus TaxID=327109 RepID=UPI002409FA57|nr:uncharacterized protein LOC129220557 [Uloborus diversus]